MASDLFLQAVRCQNQGGRPPIWLMRQAGRYMAEYRALRANYSFLELCHTPELAAQVTQLPITAFGMDAAILFSDILVVAEAFDVGLRFDEGHGPIIERPLSTAKEVAALPTPHMAQMLSYVPEAIALLKPQLKVPLIGFCGAPFTVASYMIEGGSSRDLKKTKRWMLSEPDSFHQLLGKITEATISYLKMQIAAKVDAIQIFDSWANVLADQQFSQFSLAYQKKILDAVGHLVPTILFCRGSSVFAEKMAQLNPAAVSLDWNCHLPSMRRVVPKTVALQGNLDPDLLYAPRDVLRKEVRRLLDGMKGDPGYIFNLGHGILPDTPVDAVKTLVEEVQCR